MTPKFRAWHKELGRMMLIEIMYFFFFDNELEELELNDLVMNDHISVYPDEIVLMQSTGLKDKNGKEIFEGDVLEIQGLRMVVKFGSYRYLEPSNMGCQSFAVVYDGLGFYVKTFNVIAPDDISPFEPETLKESVVIGNEFENPELLEAEE